MALIGSETFSNDRSRLLVATTGVGAGDLATATFTGAEPSLRKRAQQDRPQYSRPIQEGRKGSMERALGKRAAGKLYSAGVIRIP
jgi:hypothetical protein